MLCVGGSGDEREAMNINHPFGNRHVDGSA